MLGRGGNAGDTDFYLQRSISSRRGTGGTNRGRSAATGAPLDPTRALGSVDRRRRRSSDYSVYCYAPNSQQSLRAFTVLSCSRTLTARHPEGSQRLLITANDCEAFEICKEWQPDSDLEFDQAVLLARSRARPLHGAAELRCFIVQC